MGMDTTNQQTERKAHRLQAKREELIECITRIVPDEGIIQSVKGLYLGRLSVPFEKLHTVLKPSFCVIAQGSKEVLLGDNSYRYDPFNYLLTTLELPCVGQVLEASREHPYLSLRLELDPQLVSSVMVEASHYTSLGNPADMRAIDVSPLDGNLLDTVLRLIQLLDSPADMPILMPMITREIVYRLLKGEQGGRLRYMTLMGGYTSVIVKAVQRIQEDFDQTLRIEHLAQELGMSVSGFHYHFKAVTAMSPLQFQKQLRLQEARRLMLSENLDATSAAYRVGYNNAAYFNREYKSIFGFSPIRDVQRLREANTAYAG